MSSAAVTIAARLKPSRSTCVPTTVPIAAIANSPAIRATALLMAEPMPACVSLIEPSIAEVSGATVIESPTPKSMMPGSNDQYETESSTKSILK